MTVAINEIEIEKKLNELFPGSVISSEKGSILIDKGSLLKVAEYLKNAHDLAFDYLTFATAVDYIDYFELVYRIVSLKYNHSIIVKTRCFDRNDPIVPSLTVIWRAAYYQEREIYDLFGIKFEGHPELKRLLLWEGFKGHPLRRDYL